MSFAILSELWLCKYFLKIVCNTSDLTILSHCRFWLLTCRADETNFLIGPEDPNDFSDFLGL